MFSSIVLNSNNVVADGNGNKLVYTFPSSKTFKDNSIVLDSMSLFYSWFNISSSYSNNVFQYTWINSAGTGYTTHTITIPSGFYDVKALNAYIQSVFVTNNHYLVHSLTNKKYFLIELLENATFYAVQMNAYAINQAYLASQGWTIPSGATWTIGATILMPQFIINSNSFRDIVGFTAGNYPAIGNTTGVTYSALSSYCPQVSPVNSLIIRCNLISNNYTIPTDVLSAVNINANFGEIISYTNSNNALIKIRDGVYEKLEITICDQDFKNIQIIDKSMVVRLLIQ